MKIELSDYFKKDFRSAYLFENNKGRRVVELVPMERGSRKRFISYAKYLWISANYKEVPIGFEVDHIDGDGRNDVIDNLQILSKRENILKHYDMNPGHMPIELVCPVCGKVFYKEYRFRNRIHEGRTTCSHKCSIQINGVHVSRRKKPLIAINILTGEEKRYESTLDATKDGFSQQSVSKCCNGKLKTYKGYFWRFL